MAIFSLWCVCTKEAVAAYEVRRVHSAHTFTPAEKKTHNSATTNSRFSFAESTRQLLPNTSVLKLNILEMWHPTTCFANHWGSLWSSHLFRHSNQTIPLFEPSRIWPTIASNFLISFQLRKCFPLQCLPISTNRLQSHTKSSRRQFVASTGMRVRPKRVDVKAHCCAHFLVVTLVALSASRQ